MLRLRQALHPNATQTQPKLDWTSSSHAPSSCPLVTHTHRTSLRFTLLLPACSFVYNVDSEAFLDLTYNFTDNPGLVAEVLYNSRNYKYWWLDEVFSLVIATLLLFLGVQQLREDYEAGLKFWTAAFWTDPLPPEDGVTPLAADDEKGESPPLPTESTPLTKGPRGEPS